MTYCSLKKSLSQQLLVLPAGSKLGNAINIKFQDICQWKCRLFPTLYLQVENNFCSQYLFESYLQKSEEYLLVYGCQILCWRSVPK